MPGAGRAELAQMARGAGYPLAERFATVAALDEGLEAALGPPGPASSPWTSIRPGPSRASGPAGRSARKALAELQALLARGPLPVREFGIER